MKTLESGSGGDGGNGKAGLQQQLFGSGNTHEINIFHRRHLKELLKLFNKEGFVKVYLLSQFIQGDFFLKMIGNIVFQIENPHIAVGIGMALYVQNVGVKMGMGRFYRLKSMFPEGMNQENL